jgi:hypothetical protein
MSVPVTLENCKYVYIGGGEAVEQPRSLTSKNAPTPHTDPFPWSLPSKTQNYDYSKNQCPFLSLWKIVNMYI